MRSARRRSFVQVSSARPIPLPSSPEEGRPFIYMAGIYNRFEDGDRFTVLTTAANGTMLPVHDRMPLILAKDQIKDWIYDPCMTAELLSQPGPKLQRYQEYEQLSLF